MNSIELYNDLIRMRKVNNLISIMKKIHSSEDDSLKQHSFVSKVMFSFIKVIGYIYIFLQLNYMITRLMYFVEIT